MPIVEKLSKFYIVHLQWNVISSIEKRFKKLVLILGFWDTSRQCEFVFWEGPTLKSFYYRPRSHHESQLYNILTFIWYMVPFTPKTQNSFPINCKHNRPCDVYTLNQNSLKTASTKYFFKTMLAGKRVFCSASSVSKNLLVSPWQMLQISTTVCA